MSYILEALRKADQERSIGDVPDLATAHWTRRSSGRVRSWIWAVLGLLVVNGVLLAVLFTRDGDSGVRSGAATPAVSTQAGQAAAPEAAKPVPLRKERTPRPALPRTSPVQVLPAPEIPARRVRPAQTERSVTASRPAATPRPSTTPGASSDRVRIGGDGTPEWNELPLDFRRDFTPPKLDVHVYAPDPSRRFVLVNLKRYAEGDTLESGAVLEKISPDSIQLEYRGKRFRIDR